MRLFLRGVFRLLLAAAFGLLVAIPVRWLFRPSSAEVATQSSMASAKVKPVAVVDDERARTRIDDEAPPHPTGFLIKGTRAVVRMSDGTIRYRDVLRPVESDPIQQITPARVIIAGETLYFKPAPRSETSGLVTGVSSPSSVAEGGVFSPPVDEGRSSWQLGEDGVYRLRDRSTLRNTYSPTR